MTTSVTIRTTRIPGRLTGGTSPLPFSVVTTHPHSLVVTFGTAPPPEDGERFEGVELEPTGRLIRLGPCRYEAEQASDGHRGRLIFLEKAYDFGSLFKSGTLVEVRQKFRQLPLLLGYKEHVKAPFRDFTADLAYDLQVYRMLFDGIDHAIEVETPETQELIRSQVLEAEGRQFFLFFDQKLAELERQIVGFTKLENERHGFYFRRQVWGVITASRFLNRTNLRPRGYAGDSLMMQQLYRNEYEGDSIFARLVHKHPVETAAAQAVRNRRVLIPREISAARREIVADGTPLRFMSVACGPAWELRDLFEQRAACGQYEFTLLDQDPEALGEAQRCIEALERRHDTSLNVRYVRDSVRTMLRTADLAGAWGRFHVIYSMGLFDYLNQPVARAVLTKLYSLLHPGGRLIVGNFHVGNPTRHYMAYWMDWMLIYRSEEELLELAEDCPDARHEIEFEETGAQMFMILKKPA